MNSKVSPIKKIYHKARRVLADLWLNRLHPDVIQVAITGSYGKTSTTHAITAVLNRHQPTLRTDLNLDTIYNVPITALRVRSQRVIVFELGIDRPNEMDFHLQITRPRIGVITGITPVHSDEAHLGSLENIIREKRKLIEALPANGMAILNRDDGHVREMAAHTQAQVLWYGTGSGADYRACQISLTLSGSRFTVITPSQTFDVETPLLGAHNCVNALAAVAVADQLGISPTLIKAALAELEPLEGRLNVEPGPLNTILINDALRANPASTRAGLEFLAELPASGGRIAVLGEMGELGDLAVKMHAEVGVVAADCDLTHLVCVGKLTRHTAEAAITNGMPKTRVHPAPRVHDAAHILQQHAQPGDLLYLKGSLLRHMERIPLILQGEEVGCEVVSCPFYHTCSECPYLKTGYNQ